MKTAKPEIDEILADPERVNAAMEEIGRREILRRKKLGLSIVVWRDGAVVEIPADEIPEDGWASARAAGASPATRP